MKRRMEPCVASSRMFLALTDINTLLLSLVEKCFRASLMPYIQEFSQAVGGKQSLTVLDFHKVAFSFNFFFLINEVCYKDAYHWMPKEKSKVIMFCTAEQAYRLLIACCLAHSAEHSVLYSLPTKSRETILLNLVTA